MWKVNRRVTRQEGHPVQRLECGNHLSILEELQQGGIVEWLEEGEQADERSDEEEELQGLNRVACAKENH